MSRKYDRDNNFTPDGNRFGRIGLFLVLLLVLAGLILTARKLDVHLSRRSVETDSFSGSDNTSYARGILNFDDITYAYYHKFENYLFIGTDHSGNEKGTGDDFQNSMADFILLMSIDMTDNSYTLLQLDRNTVTTIHLIDKEGNGEATAYQQLCTAHWYGGTKELGCQNVGRSVTELLGGVPISGFMSISLDDIPALNNAIGGVTVVMRENLTNIDKAFKKGVRVTLSDKQAEEFLQARMDAGNGTNSERMQRQTDYLNAFLNEGITKTGEDPRYYYKVFEAIEDIAVTNLSGKQFSRIAKAMTENTFRGLLQIDGETKVGTVLRDGLEHEEFYPDGRSRLNVLTAMYSLEKQAEETEEEGTEDWEETEGDQTEYAVEYDPDQTEEETVSEEDAELEALISKIQQTETET